MLKRSFLLASLALALVSCTLPTSSINSDDTDDPTPSATVSTKPTLTSVEPSLATPGSKITLTGTNFKAGKALTIKLGSKLLAESTRVDDETATAIIPNDGASGKLVLSIGLSKSNELDLTVMKTISLSPALTELHRGSEAQLTATAADSEGKTLSSPPLKWEIEGTSLSLSDGKVTGVKTGISTVRVSYGTLKAERAITVFDITGVAIDSSKFNKIDNVLALCTLPTDGSTPDPGFATESTLAAQVSASDQKNHAVTWKSSDPTKATVTDGVVKTVSTATPGSVTITATSVDDPSQSASITIQIKDQASLVLEVS